MEWIVTGDQNLNKRRWDPVQKKPNFIQMFSEQPHKNKYWAAREVSAEIQCSDLSPALVRYRQRETGYSHERARWKQKNEPW